MRKMILGVLFSFLFLSGKGAVQAQTFLPEANLCEVSAEEILAVIKSTYNLPPVSDKVLIAGEVRAGHLLISKTPLSAVQLLAMSGGFSKNASFRFYLIRQIEGKASKQEIDFTAIKQGGAKDIMLKNGDVIFVPRGCVDGKLLPPSKPPANLFRPGGTDSPIRTIDKPVSR